MIRLARATSLEFWSIWLANFFSASAYAASVSTGAQAASSSTTAANAANFMAQLNLQRAKDHPALDASGLSPCTQFVLRCQHDPPCAGPARFLCPSPLLFPPDHPV